MSVQLAKEIYNNPWLVDPRTLSVYTEMLLDFRNGVQFKSDVKANTPSLESVPRGTSTAEDHKLIATYNFDGPITKGGGMSHYGTKDISAEFRQNDSDADVLGHLIVADSGGGSANAVKYMLDPIKNRKKPLVAFIDDMACSAMYWIIAHADYIIAIDNRSIVGSIGCVMEFRGHKANTELPDGSRVIRAYASQSTKKNEEFEQALNNFNLNLLQEQLLDPLCDDFIQDVQGARPSLTDKHFTGMHCFAGDSVGEFVDEIGDMNRAVSVLQNLAENDIKYNAGMSKNITSAETIKQKQMNIEQLQSEHPDVYSKAVQQGKADGAPESIQKGIDQEKARTDAILEWWDVDQESCLTAIKDGTKADLTFINKMNALSAKKSKLKVAETGNAGASATQKGEETDLVSESNPNGSTEIDEINQKYGI